MARISFDPGYFRKILKDYSDWRFAYAREAGQNSLDAGATLINVTTALNADGNTVVEWTDNGKGMGRDTVETRFMAVGGSLKDSGNAGGFGLAKLILAFAHICYMILTRDIVVAGRNDEYDISDAPSYLNGLTLRTTIEGNFVTNINEAVRDWVRYTTPLRSVLFYLNGQAMDWMPSLPAPVSIQPWCAIHSPDGTYDNDVRVRINGQYMFSVWSSVDRCFLIELTGSSLEYLTSNRDSLQWAYKDKLTKLIESMTRDPEALFDTDSDIIELFEGSDGPAIGNVERIAALAPVSSAGRPSWNPSEDTSELSSELRITCQPIDSLRTTKRNDETRRAPERLNGHDFVILNKTNKSIPSKYTVGGMRPMEWKLLQRWTRIVQACASILGVRRTIRTGWIFSVTAQAAYKASQSHGSLVLLNPCKLEGSAWVKGFDTSKDSFYTLVSLAVHELTHIGHSYHDEAYAGALTDNMAKVFANMATVNKAK